METYYSINPELQRAAAGFFWRDDWESVREFLSFTDDLQGKEVVNI